MQLFKQKAKVSRMYQNRRMYTVIQKSGSMVYRCNFLASIRSLKIKIKVVKFRPRQKKIILVAALHGFALQNGKWFFLGATDGRRRKRWRGIEVKETRGVCKCDQFVQIIDIPIESRKFCFLVQKNHSTLQRKTGPTLHRTNDVDY